MSEDRICTNCEEAPARYICGRCGEIACEECADTDGMVCVACAPPLKKIVRRSGEKPKKPKDYATIGVLQDGKPWSKFLGELQASDEFGHLSTEVIIRERNKAVDWLRSKGRRQKNYKSFLKNWLRNYMERNNAGPGHERQMVL